MRIVCISGKAESGKDYTANLMAKALEEEGYRVFIDHYGDLVKYIATKYFGWDGKKDEKGRALLQYIGTEVIRKQKPDYFVNFVLDMMKFFPDRWDIVLIPDTRFPNEIMRIYEEGFPCSHMRIFRKNHKSRLTEEQLNHSSETALDEFPVEYCCFNPGDESYDESIRNFVKKTFLPEEFPSEPKRRKLRILVDIDDTLWNLLTPWTKRLNEIYGYCVKPEDVTDWDLAKAYPDINPNSIYAPFQFDDFWDYVEPNPESQKYLKKLIDDGHDVTIVTSTSPFHDGCAAKMKRFKELYPFVDTHNVILCYNKQLLNADVMIDDGVHNLKGGNYQKILFDQGHNRNFSEEEIGARRVYNWEEVYKEVDRIAKEDRR